MGGSGAGGGVGADARDTVFHILSNRRRRLILAVLADDEPHDIRSLSTQVAARERGVESGAVTHAQRKSVYASLYQNHLPRLVDTGFVEADDGWSEIRLTERGANIDAYVGVDGDDRWCLRYGGAAGLGIAVTLAGVSGVPPFYLVPASIYALAVASVFVLVASAHARSRRRGRWSVLVDEDDGPA